jgi:WD40 repeat protein
MPVLQSGHSGPILAMAKDEANGVLFTGGKDGSVRIWSGTPLVLERKIQVSHYPILSIAADPVKKRIAVIESNGLTQHFLSVWNWETGTRRFQFPLAEFPLFMQFSPQGNFLGIAKPTWDSLSFFDAENGHKLSYVQEGFGIVNFFLVSSSENTLLSYSPSSGTFIYWNLKEGSRKSTIQSVPELKLLTTLTERYAVGADSRALYLIDLVTGETLSRSATGKTVKILVIRETEELLTLTEEGGASSLNYWKYSLPSLPGGMGGLYPQETKNRRLPQSVSQAQYFHNKIYVGFQDGSLGVFTANSPFYTQEGTNILEPITDMLVQEGTLYISTKKNLFAFPLSSLLNGYLADAPKANTLPFNQFENLYDTPLNMIPYQNSEIILWPKNSNSPGFLSSLNPETATLQKLKDFSLPLIGAWSSGEGLFCLEKNGSIVKLSLPNLEEEFRIPAGDIQTLLPLENETLLLGRNTAGFYNTPLSTLNTKTRETVPFHYPSVFLVFKLIRNPATNQVFFLALRQGTERETETVLFTADLENLEDFRPLAVLRSEDLEADLALDPHTGELLTTLGTGSIRSWDGTRWQTFQQNNNLASILRPFGDWVLAVNKDGSASIWERKGKEYLGDLICLSMGGWVILARDGTYWTSPGVRGADILKFR